jgi:hypothetical protein
MTPRKVRGLTLKRNAQADAPRLPERWFEEYRLSRSSAPARFNVSEQSGTGATKVACKAYSLDLQVNPIDG